MTGTAGSPEIVYAAAEEVIDFTTAMFENRGVPAEHARTSAECLVQADLRGVETHGIARLPVYLQRLERGMVVPNPPLDIEQTTPAAARLDGGNGLGFVVGRKAMSHAIEMAGTYGIGMVAANNSNHFGMAASYLIQAIEAGFIAMVFTNASKAMPPWGGRDGLLGTSPFAAGAPSGKEAPFILDMSPAVAARGKIRKAERLGEQIPLGYALDADGKPTTDPSAAMKGVVLPIGGPKGSGIAMLMDIMGGIFSGANFGGDVNDQYNVWDKPQGVGHFFLAIKPGLFVTEEGFRTRMDELARRVHGARTAEGFDEVLMPGEIETRLEAERRRSGIPYKAAELKAIETVAEEAGIAMMATSATKLA
jgi:LDH2 family malate/lactate/ureidoglycolate dehydrogenase